MLEKEIQNIIEINSGKIKYLGEKFPLFELQNVKLHPAIIKYILSSVDFQFQIEKQFIQKNSKFDYSGEKIEKLFSLISRELKKEKEFSFIYINELLKEAVKFNANFLAKPNTTLLNFIFDDKREISTTEINSKLKFAYYYKYISKLVQSFLSKKKTQTISRKEFAFLLNKIDQITKKNHLQNLINTALNSMVNFFDQTNFPQNEFPFDVIQMFFEEKELSNFSQRLNLQFEYNKPHKLNLSDVQKLFISDFDGIEITEENNLELIENNINLEENKIADIEEIKEEVLIPLNVNTEIIEEKNIDTNENRFFGLENSDEQKIELIKTNTENNLSQKTEITTEENSENKLNEISFASEKTEIENIEIGKPDCEKDISKKIIEQNLPVNLELSNGKPDIKKIVRNLIDVNSIFNSLLSNPLPFEKGNQFKEINLSEIVNSSLYQFDITNISENLLVDVPTDEQYLGIVEDKSNYDFVDSNEQIESIILGSEIPIEEEKIISESKLTEVESRILEQNEEIDFNSKIDEIIKNENFENEFLQNNLHTNIDDLDNDEIQDMDNLIDDEKLKLNDDDEVTEVFTDLTYLEKDEVEEKNVNEKIENVIQNQIENLSQDFQENFTDSQTGVKVIFSSFQELVSTKEMTNIIGTMFDYDMEDYYGIVRKISNAFDEREALEITNNYCRNNHIDLMHDDVIEFKTYITDYFTQSQ
ncbi:MAG: hypothetical protein IPM32_06770 [Ignavibacteriae bacterium]|nr:hypothetical protein [Ignavibacteriota bacterium]